MIVGSEKVKSLKIYFLFFIQSLMICLNVVLVLDSTSEARVSQCGVESHSIGCMGITVGGIIGCYEDITDQSHPGQCVLSLTSFVGGNTSKF